MINVLVRTRTVTATSRTLSSNVAATSTTTSTSTAAFTDPPSMKYNKAKKAYKESLKPLRKQFAETYKAKQDAIEQAKVLDLTTARAEKMARDASKRDLVIKNKALNEERLALFRKAKQERFISVDKEKRTPWVAQMTKAQEEFVASLTTSNKSDSPIGSPSTPLAAGGPLNQQLPPPSEGWITSIEQLNELLSDDAVIHGEDENEEDEEEDEEEDDLYGSSEINIINADSAKSKSKSKPKPTLTLNIPSSKSNSTPTTSSTENFWSRAGSVLGSSRETFINDVSGGENHGETTRTGGIGAGPQTEDIRKSFGQYSARVLNPRHRQYPVGALYEHFDEDEESRRESDSGGRDSLLYKTLLNHSQNATRASIMTNEIVADSVDYDEQQMRDLSMNERKAVEEMKSAMQDFDLSDIYVAEDGGDTYASEKIEVKLQKFGNTDDFNRWDIEGPGPDAHDYENEGIVGVEGKGIYEGIVFGRPEPAKAEKDWEIGPFATSSEEGGGQ